MKIEKSTAQKTEKYLFFEKLWDICEKLWDICDFDLLFKIKDEEKFILIENKFKSLPDIKQLKKYSEKLKKKVDIGTYVNEEEKQKRYATDENTYCVILSPKITALKQEDENWKKCFYEELIDKIKEKFLPEEFQKIADYYCDFTNAILHAMEEFIKKSFRNSKKMIWQGSNNAYSDKIRKLRISDLFKKLWGQKLLSKIKLDDSEINARVDYSHDSVCIDFKKNLDDEIICGVQMQDKHFNVYIELNQKSPDENKIDNLLREALGKVFAEKQLKEKDRDKERKCRHYGEKFLYHYVELDDEFSITDLSKRINDTFICFTENEKLKDIFKE